MTPLTSNKTRLNAAIDDLSTGGTTAGQIGAAWGWYMISPNFTNVWDDEAENKPPPMTRTISIKVAVLMTDGEFNYQSCYGVTDRSCRHPSRPQLRYEGSLRAGAKRSAPT